MTIKSDVAHSLLSVIVEANAALSVSLRQRPALETRQVGRARKPHLWRLRAAAAIAHAHCEDIIRYIQF